MAEDAPFDPDTKPIDTSTTGKKRKTTTTKTRAVKTDAPKTTRKRAVKTDMPTDSPTPEPKQGKKHLLLVESPTKARTINKFLGRDFIVKASMGHVRDIPSKGLKKGDFGIDIANGYKPNYQPIASREKTITELKTALEKSDQVYLAPDPDREGEAIAWHLKEILDLPDSRIHRVTFNAITKQAVSQAMQNPGKIDMNLVNAQQGRRVLDRLVGFSLSPLLWRKISKGLSAGRVQSVAMRMIVDREREIRAFIPVEFWRIIAALSGSTNVQFNANLMEWAGEKYENGRLMSWNEERATAVVAELEKSPFTVLDLIEREVKGNPSAPYITSTLQQSASTILHYTTSKTMRIAQQLYEGIDIDGSPIGLITYMRTDSVNIAPEAITEIRDFIGQNYAADYLPEQPRRYTSRANAQEAHEAIRPTAVELTPDKVKPFLTPEQYRLYDLIWRRAVASQMASAVYKTTTARIGATQGIFEAKGRRTLFDGHTTLSLAMEAKKREKKANSDNNESDSENSNADEASTPDQELPPLTVGQQLKVGQINPSQHYTQPPPRYTEASLVRVLEKEGIGRPSTYATIMQTIQKRGYAQLRKRAFYATELGIAVNDLLQTQFPEIIDSHFTANMESSLDHVEEGSADWVKLVDDFYQPFVEKLKNSTDNVEPLKGRPAPNGEKCPLCGADMLIRYSQSGAFLGCTNYPDCRGTTPLASEANPDDPDEGEIEPVNVECPHCHVPFVLRNSRFGPFFSCKNYPECRQTLPVGQDNRPVVNQNSFRRCPKCNEVMNLKVNKTGQNTTCANPECKFKEHFDKNGNLLDVPVVEGMICELCGAPMAVKMSWRGPFMACTAFPKCRKTAPLPGEEKPAAKKKTDNTTT